MVGRGQRHELLQGDAALLHAFAEQQRQAQRLMLAGVTLRDPARFDLRGELNAGTDVVIDVNVVVEGKVALVIGGAGGNDGGHVLFWKLAEANEFFDFKLPSMCRDLDLHPDHLRLATTHDDNMLRLWQMTAKG